MRKCYNKWINSSTQKMLQLQLIKVCSQNCAEKKISANGLNWAAFMGRPAQRLFACHRWLRPYRRMRDGRRCPFVIPKRVADCSAGRATPWTGATQRRRRWAAAAARARRMRNSVERRVRQVRPHPSSVSSLWARRCYGLICPSKRTPLPSSASALDRSLA